MRALAVHSEDEEDGPVIVGGAEDPELTAVHELRGSFPMAFGKRDTNESAHALAKRASVAKPLHHSSALLPTPLVHRQRQLQPC